jgi:asparagine synthase (glutamine-hydrolysing)
MSCDVALAHWDRDLRHLTLARDRFGEKPLYDGWIGDVAGQGSGLTPSRTFVFGSELKALRFNHVPASLSICEGIFKLLPGT